MEDLKSPSNKSAASSDFPLIKPELSVRRREGDLLSVALFYEIGISTGHTLKEILCQKSQMRLL
jgi:hypothetical protein